MGLKKKKLESKEAVEFALTKSKDRLEILPPLNRPFDLAMQGAIPVRLNDILVKEITSNNSKSVYEAANTPYIAEVEELRLDNIDHIETVFRKIHRGIYPDTILASYGIDRYSRVLPNMETPADVKSVSGHIHTGNARIVTLGLPHMLDFPESAIALRLLDVLALEATNNSTENTAGLALLALTTSVNIGITLVEDQRAQMDFNLRAIEAPARRVEEGNWGVEFEATKEFTSIYIKSKMLNTEADAIAPTWRLGKVKTARGKDSVAGVTKTAIAHGEVELDTTQEGDLCLFGSCPGCHDIIFLLKIVAGEDREFTFHFELLIP